MGISARHEPVTEGDACNGTSVSREQPISHRCSNLTLVPHPLCGPALPTEAPRTPVPLPFYHLPHCHNVNLQMLNTILCPTLEAQVAEASVYAFDCEGSCLPG